MKYRRQVAETADGATRHLLANLGDAEALAGNPLVGHLLEGADGRRAYELLATIRAAVDRALAQLLDLSPESERDIALRYYNILLRYDVCGESRLTVAVDLGISERQLFRDRSLACKRLAPLLQAQLANPPRQAAHVTDAYRLEHNYCEMMRRLGNPEGAGARLRELGATAGELPLRIFSWSRAADAFIDAEDDRAADETMRAARRALLEAGEDASVAFERQCLEMVEGRRLYLAGKERDALDLAEYALPQMHASKALAEPIAFEAFVNQLIYVAEWYCIFGERHRMFELHAHARRELLARSPLVESAQLYLTIENTAATFGTGEEAERRLIECLNEAIRLREPGLAAATYLSLFKCRFARHDREGARDLLRRCIDAYELAGNSQRKRAAELQFALLESQDGDPDLALTLSARAADTLSRRGYFGIAVRLCAGTALFRKREYELAREKASLAVAEAHNGFDKVIYFRSLVLLANCQMRLGQESLARESIRDALHALAAWDAREKYPHIAALIYKAAATITRDLRYRLKARELTPRTPVRRPNSIPKYRA